MSNAARFSNLPQKFGAPWTPAELAPLAWFDVADRATITEAAPGIVSQVGDKSGNGLHLEQPNGAYQPSIGVDFMNGLDLVSFFNSGKQLYSDGVAAGIGNGPYALTGVFRWPDDINNQASNPVIRMNPVGSILKARLEAYAGQSPPPNNNIWFPDYAKGTYGYTDEQLMDMGYGDDCMVTMQRTTAVLGEGWQNGHAVDPLVLTQNNTFAYFSIGADRSSSWGINGPYTNPKMGEIVVTDSAMTAENRKKLEGYLAHKWGLTANLPADHPYKRFSPGLYF
jgi:hypothetical protein